MYGKLLIVHAWKNQISPFLKCPCLTPGFQHSAWSYLFTLGDPRKDNCWYLEDIFVIIAFDQRVVMASHPPFWGVWIEAAESQRGQWPSTQGGAVWTRLASGCCEKWNWSDRIKRACFIRLCSVYLHRGIETKSKKRVSCRSWKPLRLLSQILGCEDRANLVLENSFLFGYGLKCNKAEWSEMRQGRPTWWPDRKHKLVVGWRLDPIDQTAGELQAPNWLRFFSAPNFEVQAQIIARYCLCNGVWLSKPLISLVLTSTFSNFKQKHVCRKRKPSDCGAKWCFVQICSYLQNPAGNWLSWNKHEVWGP